MRGILYCSGDTSLHFMIGGDWHRGARTPQPRWIFAVLGLQHFIPFGCT